MSYAWGNVGRITQGIEIWAQLGFGKQRNQTINITSGFYIETFGLSGHQIQHFPPGPNENSDHAYKLEIDTDTGLVSFFIDDAPVGNFSEKGFINLAGLEIQFAGEMINENDKIPGKNEDKCTISNCKYRNANNQWDNVSLTGNDGTVSGNFKEKVDISINNGNAQIWTKSV